MGFHTHYWSCSKFADWIRGTKKLNSGTFEEWDEWHKQAQSAHPVRYWIADELLDHIQDFVTWPATKLRDVRCYINNRWITRSHALTSHPRDIKRGDWCDVGNRFLPCLFNQLVDFVEVESAWHHVMWDKEARKKYNVPWQRRWFKWRTWRCPEAGLAYFEWASELTWDLNPDHKEYGKPTAQAVAARETLELYHWWTMVYPNRPDPMDESGWSQYYDMKKDNALDEKERAKLNKLRDQSLKKLAKIEAAYAKEDEQMMIRLIKIRGSLWT